MIEILVALFITLLPSLSTVELVDSPDRHIVGMHGEAVVGHATCSDWEWRDEWVCEGHPVLTLAQGRGLANAINVWGAYHRGTLRSVDAVINFKTFVHELIHAHDLMDNGRFDGSPGHPRPATRPSGLSDLHWADGDDAHWYVFAVLRTGRLN